MAMKGGIQGLTAMLAAAGLASVGAAASKSPADKLVDALVACHALADDAQKLACYERQVGELTALRERSGSLVAARTQASTFSPIDAKLQGVSDFGDGHWLLILSDHSVWRTQEAIRFEPHQGDRVRVNKGPLGSYDAEIGNQRPIKVKLLK